jgi:release factor glutamine methyltransferase
VGTSGDEAAAGGTVTWRSLLAETETILRDASVDHPDQQARWFVEEASGMDGAELVLGLDGLATKGPVAHLDNMVGRRCAGEPIQYVLGHWSFRHLDLVVDPRVLIPRPETEQVVDAALAELDAVGAVRPDGHRLKVVDLGTGSGAIALAVATERPRTEVWAVDAEPGAVAVARANLAGLGMAGTRVRVVEGSWFDPLPDELRGLVDLVIANPPYIASSEDLPPEVVDWEPGSALISGSSGLEAYQVILDQVCGWLAPGGALVLEIGATQGAAVRSLADEAGLGVMGVLSDHAGLHRIVVARAGQQ